MNTRSRIPVVAVALFALLSALTLVLVVSSPAPAAADGPDFEIMGRSERYAGKTYADWAETWHQWVLKLPPENHPMFDEDGGDCWRGQTYPVWFLTGVLGAGEVERTCDVPEGKPVFFPVHNAMYFPWSTDPPLSQQDKRGIENGFRQAVNGASATAQIDNTRVDGLRRYHFSTGWFDAWVPDDNLIDFFWPEYSDWPEGYSGPHYNYGLYLMVFLDEGQHDIHFTGWDGGLDVTYHLDVD